MPTCKWSGCKHESIGTFVGGDGDTATFCDKHLGIFVIQASEFLNTQFSNMGGDKIVGVEEFNNSNIIDFQEELRKRGLIAVDGI